MNSKHIKEQPEPIVDLDPYCFSSSWGSYMDTMLNGDYFDSMFASDTTASVDSIHNDSFLRGNSLAEMRPAEVVLEKAMHGFVSRV